MTGVSPGRVEASGSFITALVDSFKPNVVVQWVALLLCIWQVRLQILSGYCD